MATNRIYERGRQFPATPTAPGSPTSGSPVLIGQLPGVALTGPHADDTVTVQTDGVFELAVTGNDGDPAAIAAGDIVYANASTAALSANDAGVRFGYALAPVASGATTTVPVKIGY